MISLYRNIIQVMEQENIKRKRGREEEEEEVKE
jgi:hypothetical protein